MECVDLHRLDEGVTCEVRQQRVRYHLRPTFLLSSLSSFFSFHFFLSAVPVVRTGLRVSKDTTKRKRKQKKGAEATDRPTKCIASTLALTSACSLSRYWWCALLLLLPASAACQPPRDCSCSATSPAPQTADRKSTGAPMRSQIDCRSHADRIAHVNLCEH